MAGIDGFGAAETEASHLVGTADGVAGAFAGVGWYLVTGFGDEGDDDAVAEDDITACVGIVFPRQFSSVDVQYWWWHLCRLGLRIPSVEHLGDGVGFCFLGGELGRIVHAHFLAFGILEGGLATGGVEQFEQTIGTFELCKTGREGAVHVGPPFRGGHDIHAAVEEGGTGCVLPGTSQQITSALMLGTVDVAVAEDISVTMVGLGGWCADDVALGAVASRHELDFAVVEIDGSAATDEIDRSTDACILHVGGAAGVGVVGVLRAEEADVLEDVSLAVLFAQGDSTVGKGFGIVAVVGPEFDVLDVGAVGILQEEGAGVADAFFLGAALYLCVLPLFADDAGVGCCQRGDDVAFTQNTVVAGADEDAVAS